MFGLMVLNCFDTIAQLRGTETPTQAISSSSVTTNESHQVSTYTNEVPDFSVSAFPMAQGGCPDTLIWEDFQDQQMPSPGWFNLDQDFAVDANGRPAEWYVTFDAQSTLPGDTNWVTASSSWFSPAGIAENFLITPEITICDPNYVLKWASKPFEGPAFLDGYKVMLSPTGAANPAVSFTVELADFAEGDAAGNIGPGIEHTSFDGNNGLLMEWTAALGAYLGQTIRIAFVHESNDDNLIYIDNIFVGLDNSYDLAADNLYRGTDYPLTPKTQVRPVIPSGDITNTSITPVSACTLNFEIIDAGLQVLLDQDETSGALAGGQTQSFTLSGAGFTPPAGVIEDYQVTITASNSTPGETDPNLSNNTAAAGFSVTDTIFSREGGNVTGASLSIGAGFEGKLCNKFELVNDDYVSSISAFRVEGLIGDTTSAEILDDLAGVPNNVVASSAVIPGFTTDPALYTYPLANGPVFLTAGTYHACIVEGEPSSALVATIGEDYIPNTASVFFNGSWSFAEDFNFLVAYVIRMNMANCEAEAGTLTADASPVCLDNGSADISATEATAPSVPNGYETIYVLTEGAGLVIVDGNPNAPEFTVTAAGDYTIHTLVYEPNSAADPNGLIVGTTGFDVNNLLIQGGGSVCGALDVTGAPIVVEECIVGIEDVLSEESIAVYPNPSNGTFTIEIERLEGEALVTILDVAGRQVYSEVVIVNGTFRKELSIDIASGSYLLQVQTVEGTVTRKLQID